jgi:hypothetical protein
LAKQSLRQLPIQECCHIVADVWWHSVVYGQLEHDVLPERGNKNIRLKQNTTTQIKIKQNQQ